MEWREMGKNVAAYFVEASAAYMTDGGIVDHEKGPWTITISGGLTSLVKCGRMDRKGP